MSEKKSNWVPLAKPTEAKEVKAIDHDICRPDLGPGHPKILDLSNFDGATEPENKVYLADCIATYLYNYDKEIFNKFMDPEVKNVYISQRVGPDDMFDIERNGRHVWIEAWCKCYPPCREPYNDSFEFWVQKFGRWQPKGAMLDEVPCEDRQSVYLAGRKLGLDILRSKLWEYPDDICASVNDYKPIDDFRAPFVEPPSK